MSTLFEMLKAAFGLGAVMALWILVQTAWRRTFPEAVGADGDALAGRLGCADCHCSEPCERKRAASAEEETT